MGRRGRSDWAYLGAKGSRPGRVRRRPRRETACGFVRRPRARTSSMGRTLLCVPGTTSYQIASGASGGPQVLDVPAMDIEWNGLGDGAQHTLVVEAVDQLEPAP